ncbi:MAG: GNAT family N-acetyltransferase [Isosphaeraceae bacterium]
MLLSGDGPRAVELEQFSTPRMIARRLRASDYEEVRRLDLHPQVMKIHLADGPALPEHVTRKGLVQNDAHWEEHRFGFWIFHDRKSGRLVGRSGLKWYSLEGRDVVGLAYSVAADQRGRGLATEMAAASLAIGFRQLRLDEVMSWTLPFNVASQRVMEKVGFRYRTDIVLAGLLHRLYRLTELDWAMDRGSRLRGRAS